MKEKFDFKTALARFALDPITWQLKKARRACFLAGLSRESDMITKKLTARLKTLWRNQP